ncbi:hypothetical protein JQ633_12425 [Bradyrhizobium tropiciagri]|uniref:DUF7220 family protein n=1 Tax=Bradyrhizobium tropiciagri TaxID=312253 RepID=UPI001BAB05D1|nr:hypothetical protein [Bradyrhizobium tropiciagri]MBR0871169.1 hypothetical protein [Bradyrhizobium tropiciagri]
MKQSRSISLLKSVISTAVGFSLSLLLQWLILPVLIGAPVPLHANLAFAAIMTAVSIARGYVLERCFEAMGWRQRKLSPFMQAVIAERFRQIDQEGWSLDHDDKHDRGELGLAGATYLIHAGTESRTVPSLWPWDGSWWKPQGRRRDLVRAGALLVAEGERFDRARNRGRGR